VQRYICNEFYTKRIKAWSKAKSVTIKAECKPIHFDKRYSKAKVKITLAHAFIRPNFV